MHRDEPVMQLPFGAAWGRMRGARACWMPLLAAAFLCVPASAASAPGDKPVPSQVKDVAPGDFVGSETCTTCHEEVAKSFLSNPHGNADLSCASCHSGHTNQSDAGGRSEKSAFADTGNSILICTKCHAEMAGPFVYKHAAIKAEGCTGCHAAHGSQNAKLLNAPNTNELCKQCHSPATESATHGTNAGTPQAAQPCTNCHTHIHGSNMNAAFLN